MTEPNTREPDEPHKPKDGGGADGYRWEEALELLGPVVSVAT